jgi:mRNA interferase RelE/StbE
MPAYSIAFKTLAEKALRKLPKTIQRRIVMAVEGLASNPRPAGAKKLTAGDELWRIRVGDYRIVYHIEDKRLVILVVRVAHRRDVYRQ